MNGCLVSGVDSGVMWSKIITNYHQHQCHDAVLLSCLLATLTDYLLNYPSSHTHLKMYENVIHLASHKCLTLVRHWGTAWIINQTVWVCVYIYMCVFAPSAYMHVCFRCLSWLLKTEYSNLKVDRRTECTVLAVVDNWNAKMPKNLMLAASF